MPNAESNPMPKLQRTVNIAATPEIVWSIVADPSFVPKLYPHVISISPAHSRIATVGNSAVVTAKMMGRKVNVLIEATEVVPNERFSVRHQPGGLFSNYKSTITLEPTKKGTKVSQDVEYDIHSGYLGKVATSIVAKKVVKDNIIQSMDNLKEIAELEEMPSTRAS
jgi:carbon monoxide dehydrogenase subunit G